MAASSRRSSRSWARTSKLVVYPDADHAFFNDTRPEVYKPEAAADAWRQNAGAVPAHICDSHTPAFVALLLFCLTPWCSPPIALALGLAFALTSAVRSRPPRQTRILLQASVVGLGFGMNLQKVLDAGRTGILFTLATIAGTLLLGYALGRAMRISSGTAHLISSGTAICGGSAIAAVGPVIGATR